MIMQAPRLTWLWAFVMAYLLSEMRFMYSALDNAAFIQSRSQVQRRQARGGVSCTLVLEAICLSSSSQTRDFVEIAEARSEAR